MKSGPIWRRMCRRTNGASPRSIWSNRSTCPTSSRRACCCASAGSRRSSSAWPSISSGTSFSAALRAPISRTDEFHLTVARKALLSNQRSDSRWGHAALRVANAEYPRPKAFPPTRPSAYHLINIVSHRDQGASMAKRSARHKARELQYHEPATVHPLFPHERGGWSPHDHDQNSRDRKYVKNVRAMSPTQQRLMDAINERAVV